MIVNQLLYVRFNRNRIVLLENSKQDFSIESFGFFFVIQLERILVSLQMYIQIESLSLTRIGDVIIVIDVVVVVVVVAVVAVVAAAVVAVVAAVVVVVVVVVVCLFALFLLSLRQH